MPYGYVYAPTSGSVWSLDCYCSWPGCNSTPPCGGAGCDHVIVGGAGFCCPIDVGGGSDGTVISFRANSVVQSIQIERISNVCSSGSSPWTDGIKVHMYRYPNAVCYMGTVLYGHLRDRTADNQTINRGGSDWNQYLGMLPSDCACGCSSGIHIHMETNVGSRNSRTCGASVYEGTSWLYNWYWNDGWC
jgi:hypothetical protein